MVRMKVVVDTRGDVDARPLALNVRFVQLEDLHVLISAFLLVSVLLDRRCVEFLIHPVCFLDLVEKVRFFIYLLVLEELRSFETIGPSVELLHDLFVVSALLEFFIDVHGLVQVSSVEVLDVFVNLVAVVTIRLDSRVQSLQRGQRVFQRLCVELEGRSVQMRLRGVLIRVDLDRESRNVLLF